MCPRLSKRRIVSCLGPWESKLRRASSDLMKAGSLARANILQIPLIVLLTRGTFARVNLAVHRKSNMQLAVKIMDRIRYGKPEYSGGTNIENEVALLRSLRHVSDSTCLYTIFPVLEMAARSLYASLTVISFLSSRQTSPLWWMSSRQHDTSTSLCNCMRQPSSPSIWSLLPISLIHFAPHEKSYSR